MSTLTDLLAEHSSLRGEDTVQLQRLVAEWQLLSDLSFADLQLWVRVDEGSAIGAGDRLVCVGQCRPNTTPTVFPDDAVGAVTTDVDSPQLAEALTRGVVLREERLRWSTQGSTRREAYPVRARSAGDPIAVLSKVINLTYPRLPSNLELSYQGTAQDMFQMIADGLFPGDEANPGGLSTPRAGDGFIRVDADGRAVYASPNAISAYHRMGIVDDFIGSDLADLTQGLVNDPFVASEVAGIIRAAIRGETGTRIEADARRASVLLRAVPLTPRGVCSGAAVLVRDVTEIKRRDLALISKDATIREIHHRVKNNLQSVSALLRLQARRASNEEARTALAEATRRVAAIALVHDTLSMGVGEEVDLDVVLDQLAGVITDLAPTAGGRISIRRVGSAGTLGSEKAMPLVQALTELLQNSVEHAYVGGDGLVRVVAERSARELRLVVEDDGVGLPAGFNPTATGRLGLQIVQTLVTIELGGRIEFTSDDGARVRLRIPLR